MHFWGKIRSILLLALLLDVSPGIAMPEDPPLFSVWFTAKGVEFSGEIDSEETGQILAEAVKSVRPDLSIVNGGLKVNPDATIPNLGELKSLLAELGLSTHEGILMMWEDRVLLSGMTDSVITLTALRIRLDPILNGRRLINRICIVHTDDLPDIKVNLTTLGISEPLLDFEAYPTAAESFELPGLYLEKIFPTLVMLSDLSKIDSSLSSPTTPMRAVPLPIQTTAPSTVDTPNRPPLLLHALPAFPESEFATLQSLHFSRSTYILQSGQEPVIEAMVKQLLEPPLRGQRIILAPIRCQGAAGAFNDYLCDNRADKVKAVLVENGIDASLLSIETIQSASPIDNGEVQIRVDLPDVETPEETEASVERTSVIGGATDSSPLSEELSEQ